MNNLTFDADNHYYSGQGVVMLGKRDPITGKPLGLRPIGNVSELKITVATTVIEHKGSQDGQRAIDKRLQTETKATASITIDNWIALNLANALRGNSTKITAGATTDELIVGGPGLVSGLKYIQVSDVVVTAGGVVLTPYVDDATPWDYKLNNNAGSIMLNDGTVLDVDGLILPGAVTAITVGATTSITVANTAEVGDTVTLSGFDGADAAVVNENTAKVVTATPTVITVDIVSTGKTITLGSGTVEFTNPVNMSVDYSYADQYVVDSLTQPLTEAWLRFEGLNTVEDNSPVIVDIFKFVTDPLKELSLLSDTFATFVMEGSMLSDGLRPAGKSKYFSVKKLN